MKKSLMILSAIVGCLLLLSGCSDKEESPKGMQNGVCARVWDDHEPNQTAFYGSRVISELGNATVERKTNQQLYLDGELLTGGAGHCCYALYVCDVTGDGVPELCFSESWGSGIVHRQITVYDYATRTLVFSLAERFVHDYNLFMRDGTLCVKETAAEAFSPTEIAEPLRTGVLACTEDGEITVLWDAEIYAS